jgi:DNA ligase 1
MALLLAELVATSRAVAETRSRRAKAARLAELLRRAAPDERVAAASWLCGELPQHKLGVGWATLRELAEAPAREIGTLTVGEVDRAFSELAALSGNGSSRVGRRA